MRVTCRCGGRYRRSDLRRVTGTDFVQDIDPFVAHWMCNKCGRTRTQRKRRPKGAVVLTPPKIFGGLASPVIVVDSRYVYGPFVSEEEARLWVDTHFVYPSKRIVRLMPPLEVATIEKAHHCGVVLED